MNSHGLSFKKVKSALKDMIPRKIVQANELSFKQI